MIGERDITFDIFFSISFVMSAGRRLVGIISYKKVFIFVDIGFTIRRPCGIIYNGGVGPIYKAAPGKIKSRLRLVDDLKVKLDRFPFSLFYI